MMRRKFGQPSSPTLYYKDGVLFIPGYTFEKAAPWHDTGSTTIIAEGNNLKDGSDVLAKIAPAQSNGSLYLEREAHILENLASMPEGYSTTLRMIDFIKIPRESGDHVVLLLAHPGLNLLGRYLPPSKVNDLLLADMTRTRPSSSYGDIYLGTLPETDMNDDMEGFDIMDLASFLEFAIQSTRCLEVLHKAGTIHREVRANAFHLNAYSGLVRFVHFGNRAVSLENLGSPSSLVLRAYDEAVKLKVKEALCYMAPEQTGSIETVVQDHRTDLYSLGILFWTLLVGRGRMPFEGGALELLHSIVQKRPMPVHEVRRDVPHVLACIIDKLLAKNPDMRYQSAYGLMQDLIKCQRRLLQTVSSASDDNAELIPAFEIALEDRFMEFTMPIALFGREKELELIRNVILSMSTSFSRHFTGENDFITLSSLASQHEIVEDITDSLSSKSGSIHLPSVSDFSAMQLQGTESSPERHMMGSTSHGETLRRDTILGGNRSSRTHVVIVVGPPGIGKSSIVLVNQAKWRGHGLWGQAKFQGSDSAPFSALLSCLSSVLRQLMVFHTDLHRFVSSLRERLGPQLQNVPLLYQGTPELKEVLALFDIHLDPPQEPLNTRELRARFQSLVENVFAVISDTRLFALFLDDLHEADTSTLDVVSTLLNSRSRMLVFATLRSDRMEVVQRVKEMFTNRYQPTWIDMEPLNYAAVSLLVSKTLHRPKEECDSLSQFVYAASSGNAFSARSVLTTLQRQHQIVFDWERNHWVFNMAAIESSLADQKITDPNDLIFLVKRLRQLPEEARKYLLWATFFGETSKVTDIALMMDWEDTAMASGTEDEHDDMRNLHKAVSNLRDTGNPAPIAVRGLQLAVTEGWLITRARDMCSFAHDRYRQAVQAEASNLAPETIAKMSFRIVLMMMHETPIDVYRVAEHAKRCLDLLQEHPKRDELLNVLLEAGESSWACGAHELAIESFESARLLLGRNIWVDKPNRTLNVLVRLSALYTWKGNLEASDAILDVCLLHCIRLEDKSNILRLRSNNRWLQGRYVEALNGTLAALQVLGVDVNPAPTQRQVDGLFEEVKNEVMAVGLDNILNIPRTTDPKTELAVSLLNDAGINAYWSPSPYCFADLIGLTTMQLALRSGMAPGTALGFFWSLGVAAERKGLYRFSIDVARIALRIAEKHGSTSEKCRAQVLFCSHVSGFDNVHVRGNLSRLEKAIMYGNSAGDRIYTCFAMIHSIVTRLYVCDHISELHTSADECVNDVNALVSAREPIILATAVLICIRVLGGFTRSESAETVFDTDKFIEKKWIEHIHSTSGNISLALNWYNSFKVVSYYAVGYIQEAAELGFNVYQSRGSHPNHRHVRYALFFHTLALLACLRNGIVSHDNQTRYLNQVKANDKYIRKWLSPSPVNTSVWIAIIDAESASLSSSPDAFRLYDMAVRLAVNNDWPGEEGWALFLQGSHFIRCGVEGLGSELQRRGISRHAQWGAQGIVNHLNKLSRQQSKHPLKRGIFSSDVAVQTEVIIPNMYTPVPPRGPKVESNDDQESVLSADDLASILKWSKDISGDIILSSALRRLTEIATETSGSQNTCVVIAREAGDYTVATSMRPPGSCQVFENPKSVREIRDPLQKAIIQHTLNSKEQICNDDASSDPRFSTEAGQTLQRSVVCLPIFSNRGQTFGAVYCASRSPFSKNTITILSLLCQQASISISNALLFRSVQTGTRENLKMIAAQRDALEAARKSQEDALKATKIKSNFLASMSHELRTPFSSFYGLLDLLSGTELNAGQNEIVQTAKQSCELLLKIIDSILDYSKLEALAVKLEPSGFLVENIIADCMELLLPMAAQKLDLSFNIEPEVPPWVFSDYARIRQVLMNLIGNAVKFTAAGSVKVICSVADIRSSSSADLHLKFEIHDTGIGLSARDVEQLFVPFQQADNSSTRQFGGTGLGLSISRQLVKLMGGIIGVASELNRGSMFWFNVPVKLHNSEESEKYARETEATVTALCHPRPLQIIIQSSSEATRSLLKTMLQRFLVRLVSSIGDLHGCIKSSVDTPVDFIIFDDQSVTAADELAQQLQSLPPPHFKDTKVIHLYTPTSSPGQAVFANPSIAGVIRMTKPPRLARLLQALAESKELALTINPHHVSDVVEDTSTQRTLYGNVLIAEDNPIAQNLLIKQLQRYNLTVVATNNGEEAIHEWEGHKPGFFSVALFDHHMPVCDGVEAVKRLRLLEKKRKSPILLPIVALSADCQDSTKQLCLSAGMNAFFSKPLKKSDLMALLSMFMPQTT